MKVTVFESKKELYQQAAKLIIDKVKAKPNIHLGLATGSTPVPLYQALINDHKMNQTSYKQVVSFNLDEYTNLDRNHPQSYYTFMKNQLFDFIDIKQSYLPNGNASDLGKEAQSYTDLLKKEGIDIQVLGLGSNGHIGFNEPHTPFESTTHIVTLDEKTRKDNARFFDNDLTKVPKQAITMGIKNIMEAKEIILIVTGKNKAEAVFKMLKGPVTEQLPASILQNHPCVMIYLDQDAASLL